MRKIILLILLALGFNAANAQWTIINGKQRFVLGMGIPTRDTTSTYGVADSSQIVLRPQDSAVYYKYKGHWRILSSKDITTFPWDSITGKPSNFPTTYALSNDVKDSIQARAKGTGANGRLTYWNGVNSISSNENLNYDAVNNRIGVGVTNPSAKVVIAGEGTTAATTSLYIRDASFSDILKITDDKLANFFGKVKVSDTLTAGTIKRNGGTATQYLMANGSVTNLIDTASYFKRTTPIAGYSATQGVITNADSLVSAISKLAGNTYDIASTGAYQFGGITLQAPGTIVYNVGPVKGFIVYNTNNVDSPKIIKVDYPGFNGFLGDPYLYTATETYLYIDSNSQLQYSPTPLTAEQRRRNIFIGKLGHPDKATYINAFNQPDIIMSPLSQLRDVWTPLNLINDGVYPSANGANLNINTSAGKLYGLGIGFTANPLSPSSINITGQSPATFQYRTQTGGANTDVTVIDPTNYDNAGTITAIGGGAGSATNQRVFMLQNGKIRLQYGQTVYGSLSDAIAGLQSEQFVIFPNFKDNAILIGVLSVVKTATNLSDPTQAKFLLVSKFGETVGAAGGVATSTLQQAYNNSSIPQIVTNTASGALAIKRGSANATDSVLVVQSSTNGTVFKVTGEGKTTAANFIKSGGTSSQYLMADGSVTTGVDTTSLSNRINTKLNIADTAAMLTPYKTYFPRNALSLTTTGTSGAATYDNSTGAFNIPQYQSVLTNPVTGTGTTNYIPKFTSTSGLGNSSIYDNGTYVGVNTNTPNYTFDVNGTGRFNATTIGNPALTVTGTHTASGAIARGAYFTPTLTAAANNDVLVGLDINPTYSLGAFTGTSSIGIRNVSGNNYFNTSSGSTLIGYATGGGIPATYKLDVNGTANINGTIFANISKLGSGLYTDQIGIGISTNGTTLSTTYGLANAKTLLFKGDLRFHGQSTAKSIYYFGAMYSGAGLTYALQNDFMTLATPTDYIGVASGTYTSNILNIIPTYNYTGGTTTLTGINYNPTLTSMTGVTHRAIQTVTGDVLLGTTSGSTGIGANTSINASAILDITSTTKGFLRPRMTTTQRDAIATPATGLSVYNTTTNTPNFYNGTSWLSNLAGSGTANYYAKFTSAGVLGNSLIYDDGTNVGIGTISPAYKLDLTSDNDGYARQWLAYQSFIGTGNGINGFQLRTLSTTGDGVKFSNGANSTEWMRITSGGRVLLNTTTDDGVNALQVNGSAKITSLAGTGERIVTADANGKLQIATSVGATGGTYTPTLSNGGNVASSSLINSTLNYTQIGNIVTVYVSINQQATTANSITQLQLTLPVTTATTTQNYIGAVTSWFGSSATSPGVVTITGANQATLTTYPPTTSTTSLTGSFTYKTN